MQTTPKQNTPFGIARIRFQGVELIPAVHVDRVELHDGTRHGARYDYKTTVRPHVWALPGGGTMTTSELLQRARATGSSLWVRTQAGFYVRKVKGRGMPWL